MPDWMANLISLIVGAGLTLLSGWVSDRRSASRERDVREEERRSTRRMRRDDFQRDTLLELQDTAMRMLRVSAAVTHRDLLAFHSTGSWPESRNYDLNADHFVVIAEVRLLATRVSDDESRKLAADFLKSAPKLVTTKSWEEAAANLVAAAGVHKALNDRIGQLIRELDDAD